MEGEPEQAALSVAGESERRRGAAGTGIDVEERRGDEAATIDDADAAALLHDEQARVGRGMTNSDRTAEAADDEIELQLVGQDRAARRGGETACGNQGQDQGGTDVHVTAPERRPPFQKPLYKPSRIRNS